MTSTTTPSPRFHLDPDSRTWMTEHVDGYLLGLLWLTTAPEKVEVVRVACIHRNLHDGGITGCDTLPLDADHFPDFLAFLSGTPRERTIEDGVEAMAAVNAEQGTNFPAWPKRCFTVSFDEAFLLGFAAACNTAVKS